MELSLAATPREEAGSGKAGRLRRMGQIPAIVYGEAQSDQKIVINGHELKRLLQNGGRSKLIALDLPQGRYQVWIKEIQRHPVNGELLHLDLMRVAMNHPVTVKVPALLVNEEKRPRDGAILEVFLHELEVNCLPARIPDRIAVDVGELALGSTLFVQDVTVPPGVKLLDPPESPVVTASAPALAPEPTPVEPEAKPEGDEVKPQEA